MSRTTSKLVKPKIEEVMETATELNYEGFPAFKRPLKERYLQMLLTNTLGGTFYASAIELVEGALELHAEMRAADPVFMAQAIVYARNNGFMRLQPIVGLAFLAKSAGFMGHYTFPAIFDRVILTPGDLQDFVEIMRGGKIGQRGMGRRVKRVVNVWLNKMTEYRALKYASGGQGYGLRDVLRLTHPIPEFVPI